VRRVTPLLILALAGACAPYGEEPAAEETAEAVEIRILSAGSLEGGLEAIAAAYTAETGNTVAIETGTTPVMRERLAAGETFDIVLGRHDVVDEAAEQGQVDLSMDPVVGRVGVGIAVRQGVELPELRNAEDLKAVLLSADTVAYNRGSSGMYVQSMIETLGIAEAIAGGATRYANGTQVMSHVREGTGVDVGLAPLTEIRANTSEGVRMVPLPDDLQNYTTYYGVLGANAVGPASRFLERLTTAEARAAFAATGVE
jgi:molybdate transport system substrate-binding protein